MRLIFFSSSIADFTSLNTHGDGILFCHYEASFADWFLASIVPLSWMRLDVLKRPDNKTKHSAQNPHSSTHLTLRPRPVRNVMSELPNRQHTALSFVQIQAQRQCPPTRKTLYINAYVPDESFLCCSMSYAICTVMLLCHARSNLRLDIAVFVLPQLNHRMPATIVVGQQLD